MSDDMVIAPRLTGAVTANAPVEARRERHMVAARKRGGVFHRIAKAKAAAKVRRVRAAKISARRLSTAKSGFRAIRGAQAAASAGRAGAAVANPIGAIVAALVVVGVVALRLGTGRSFEGMGAKVNQMLLGDLDEEARATMDVRKRLGSDRHIARIIAQEGFVNDDIRAIAEDLKRVQLAHQKGSSRFQEDSHFDVNGTLDILILRARDLIVSAFVDSGGAENMIDLRTNFRGLEGAGDLRMGSGR